jgi:hypothetical protein
MKSIYELSPLATIHLRYCFILFFFILKLSPFLSIFFGTVSIHFTLIFFIKLFFIYSTAFFPIIQRLYRKAKIFQPEMP